MRCGPRTAAPATTSAWSSPTYTSGVAGHRVRRRQDGASGWDKSGADQVAAHEWGHNWGRQHAPCGDPPATPIRTTRTPAARSASTASTSPPGAQAAHLSPTSWATATTSGSATTPTRACSTTARRSPTSPPAFAQAMQPCLLVWGRIVNGQPVLEPAFQIVTRPQPAGPRRARTASRARAADGSRVFSLGFTPEQVADDPPAAQQFAFAVPLQPDRAARLDALRLSVPGRPAVSLRAAAASGGRRRTCARPRASARPGVAPVGCRGASDG